MNKIISKNFNKIILIFEFIISLFGTFCIYKSLISMQSTGKYNYIYTTLSILYIIILTILIIYFCKKNYEYIEKLFLIFMIPIGMLYLIFMIPTHIPDELPHMWKAYEVSEGILFTQKSDEGVGKTFVPEDLLEYGRVYLDKYDVLNETINTHTDYNNVVELSSPAQNYPFILYVLPSIGFIIGRIFNLNIIIAEYIGQMLNFILFIILGYYSIKKIPFGKILLFVYLFIPMVIHQAVSFSGDSFINSISIFYISLVLNIAFSEKKISLKEKIILILLTFFISIAKIVYVPIIGVLVILFNNKNNIKSETIKFVVLNIFIAIISSVVWYIYSSSFVNISAQQYFIDEGVDSSLQIKFILKNPIDFMKVIFNDLKVNGKNYINMFIGLKLGWLNIVIDSAIINIYGFLLIFSSLVENNAKCFSRKQKIWIVLISIVSIILVLTALYITWTGVEKSIIEGVQGRYFIPICLLPLLCLCMKNNYVKIKNINVVIPIVVSILNIFVINGIFKFFII